MRRSILSLLAVFMVVWPRAAAGAGLQATRCFCEFTADPLGVDNPRPRFTWELESAQRAQLQSAYQVLVATSEQVLAGNAGDRWDSGKIASDRSVNVEYAGSPLSSGEKCFWKVRVWDAADSPGPWSEPATFEMGLLQEADWQGGWIGSGWSPVYTSGRFGQAVQFNGTDQSLRIPHAAALKPAAQITIAAWVQPGAALDEAWREVYRKEDGAARHLLALGRTGSITGLWVGLGINGGYVEFGANTALAALKDQQWHLLAATYDGAQIRLYVDGAQIGGKIQSGPLATSGTSPAFIGSASGAGEFFPGGIDDLRVYGRALSSGEVHDLYDGTSVDAGGLAGWWKLDGNTTDSVSGVAAEPRGGSLATAPLLRKRVRIDKPLERARVYMSGVGWSELFINGTRVGDHVLDPAATDYNKRVLYVTHDVTGLLQPGDNVLGVTLGNGWFSEPPTPGYGDSPRLRFQMNLRSADGSTRSIIGDSSWKCAPGPLLRNDIFGGETFDARLEPAGWLLPAFDDAGWTDAQAVAAPGGVMESQLMPAIKVVQTLPPVRLTNPAAGVYVYDLGQLFGGWTRLRVKGPAGTKVTIKYATRMLGTGLVDKSMMPEPQETDYYILRGDPAGEVYEPRFTYHPVWYVQIEGYPGTPALGDLDGRVVRSAVDFTGDFECSNTLLNRIHRNAVWTLSNQLFGFPLDCLHREHWGWLEPGTNPSTLFARKHMPLFWEKFLDDARYAQHADGVIPDVVPAYPLKGRSTGDPAWAGNYPLLVWYLYQYYDDRRLLEVHYPAMRGWMEHLVADATGYLLKKGYYGDHMLPGDAPGQEQFISTETPPAQLWTGYYYRNAAILAEVATLLGNTADAQKYGQLATSVAAALNAEWFNPTTAQYAGGSQTSNIMPLALGIVPADRQSQVVSNIAASIRARNTHFRTGNLGTSCLMELSLASLGQGDLMYEVLNQQTYPGFGYEIAQGATALWEGWSPSAGEDSMDMWGSVDEFFYKDLAGIRGPDYFGPGRMAPGFREIVIRPHMLGDLTFAKATMRTVRGLIASDWKLADGRLTFTVSIPVNSLARVYVPVIGTHPVIRESDKVVWQEGAYVPGAAGISSAAVDGAYVRFDIGSGTYTFTLPADVTNRTSGRKFSAVQPAIDDAMDGEEIVVGQGTYRERISLNGKRITVRAESLDPARPCVLEPDGTGPAVTFTGGEDRSCRLIGLTIRGGRNPTAEGGGVLCKTGSSPLISHCRFEANAARFGGGLASLSASPLLVNCTWVGNSAELGGAIYASASQIGLVNCTLAGNASSSGAGITCRSPRLQQPSSLAVTNSILWDEGPEIVNYDASSLTISSCDVRGGWPGTQVLDTDPHFLRAPDGGGNGWGDDPATTDVDEGADDDWGLLELRPCSPCLDAGLAAALPPDGGDIDDDGDLLEPLPLDIAGHARVTGPAVDLGAVESGPAAVLVADVDRDCDIDLQDLALFTLCGTGPAQGPPGLACITSDLDGDGDVDQEDFGRFQRCMSDQASFLPECTSPAPGSPGASAIWGRQLARNQASLPHEA